MFTGNERGSVESTDVDNAREFVIAVSSVFGSMTLLMAILVIAGTVGLSVTQQHRDIALLRAVAATPRQVRRMVVWETGVLGVLAAAAGIWPGLIGAAWLRDQFVSPGMVPATFQMRLSWLPPLIAGSATLLIALLAAWIASLRASRIRPTAALAETAVERRGLGVVRTAIGLIALAGGVTLCLVSASTGDSAAGTSVATVFTLVVAVALLAPLVIRAASATAGRVLAATGVTGRVAIANLDASARSLAAVLSSLVLALALGGSLWFVQTSEQHVAAQQSRAGVLADYVVTPSASGGLTAEVATALRRSDGVVAVTGMVHSTMFASADGITDYSAQGLDADGLSRTLDLDVISGTMAALQGDTIAVDASTAAELHLRVGGVFVGWYGDGGRRACGWSRSIVVASDSLS